MKIVYFFIFILFLGGCSATQKYKYLLSNYNNLSSNSIRDYDKEKTILKELILLEEKNITLDKTNFSTNFNQFFHHFALGKLYYIAHEYDKALEEYLFARKLVKKDDVSSLTDIVIHISYIYWKLSKKEEAISLLNNFSKTYEKKIKNTVFKQKIDDTLMKYYLDKKQFKKITRIILEKEPIDNNISSRFCNRYNKLGDISLYEGKYKKAEKLYKYTLAVAKKQKIINLKTKRGIEVFKVMHYDSDTSPYIDLVTSYYKLGYLYAKKRDVNQSVYYLTKALNAPNLLLSEKVKIKQALSLAYLSKKPFDNYEKSISYLKEAISITKEVLGEASATTLYMQVSQLYYETNDYKNSYKYMQKSYDIFLKNRHNNFTVLTNSERVNYLKMKETLLLNLLDITFNYQKELLVKEKSKLFKTTLTDWLNYKGSISDTENMIRTLKNQTTDSDTIEQITKFEEAQKAYASFVQNGQKKEIIEKKKSEIDEIFKWLALKVNKFQEENELQSINYHDIAKYLKKNELYIDYARAGDNYYLFSLDLQENVSFVKLEKQFLPLIQAFRNEVRTIADKKLVNYPMNQNSKDRISKLYKLLLEPIKEQLSAKKSLIISTDGALRLLPFETLYNQQNQHYLIEEKEIRYIPSGKEFVRLHKYTKKESTSSNKIVIFANPNDTNTNNSNQNRKVPKFFKRFNLSALKGAEEEAKEIKRLFGNVVSIFSKKFATEAKLLEVKQPKILHIATHGFFNNDKKIQNPMLKSGLVLSEARLSRQNGTLNGFTTALKLSELDLKGTELVVLSACDTGMVDIDATDSISGLGKAFIQAGAKNVVMSLWSVNDTMTKELMINFYQNIKNGLSYSHAMTEAKLKMIKKGLHPFYWGGFVLSGL